MNRRKEIIEKAKEGKHKFEDDEEEGETRPQGRRNNKKSKVVMNEEDFPDL